MNDEELAELRTEYEENPARFVWVYGETTVGLLGRLASAEADRECVRKALAFLDLISPSGWHVERAREALQAALEAGKEST